MAKVKRYRVDITHKDAIDVEVRLDAGRVVGFAANYRAVIGGRWVEVVRYDTAHGHLHVHRSWRRAGHRVGPVEDPPSTAADYAWALKEAKMDLKRNWRRYRRHMEEALR